MVFFDIELTRRNLLRGGTTIGVAKLLAGGALSSIPDTTEAQERSHRAQALLWSENNAGIALAIKIGNNSSYSAQELASAVGGALNRLGVQQVVFFSEERSTPGNAITFLFHGVADGPYGIRDAQENLQDIVARWRVELPEGDQQ